MEDLTSIAIDTWYHIALVRNGNNWHLFLDGDEKAMETIDYTLFSGTSPARIGVIVAASTFVNYFNGFIDELRVSNGIARWTSNFTPPSAAY